MGSSPCFLPGPQSVQTSGQKGPLRGWDEDIRSAIGWGPDFASHRKERDVHTKTSTAVLFIRGASLETESKCPAAGEGEQTSEPLGGVPRSGGQ